MSDYIATTKDLQMQNSLVGTSGGPVPKWKETAYKTLMYKYHGFPSFENEIPQRSDIYELSEGKDWLGNSVYDQDFYNEQELENLMDVRAENQPWISKVGSGVAKGVLNFGTTFLNGTVGLVTALGTGIYNMFDEDANTNFLTGFVDNPYLDVANAVTKWGEDVFPNYYTSEELTNERNGQWWKNIASGNFIGDKILKNAGFTIGALYSGAGISSGLAKLMPTASGLVRGTATSILSAVNEASLDASNNINDDWLIEGNRLLDEEAVKFKKDLDAKYAGLISGLESDYYEKAKTSGFIMNPETGVAENIANVEFKQKLSELKASYDAELANNDAAIKASRQKLADLRLKVATTDFLLQLPTLTASNILQWGRLFGNGFKTANRTSHIISNGEKKLAQVAGTKEAADLYKMSKFKQRFGGVGMGLMRGTTEGLEEVGQKYDYEVPKVYYMNDVMNFYKASMDPDAELDTITWMDAYTQGLGNVLRDPTTSEEFALGFLPGALGVPVFGKKFTSSNETWLGRGKAVGVTGGLGGAIKSNREQTAKDELLLRSINERVQREDFVNYWQGLIRNKKYETEKDKAIALHDKMKYEDADQAQMISDIVMFDNAGKIEDLVDFVSAITEESSDNISEIVKETTKKLSDSPAIRSQLKGVVNDIKFYESELNRIANLEVGSIDSVVNNETGEIVSVEVTDEYKKARLQETKNTIDNLKQSLVSLKDELNKTVGPFVDERGNAYNEQEIKSYLTKNRQDLLETIDIYKQAKRDIDSESENALTTEQLTNLTWLKTHTAKWQKRIGTMASELRQSALPQLLDYYTKVAEKNPQKHAQDVVFLTALMNADPISASALIGSSDIISVARDMGIEEADVKKMQDMVTLIDLVKEYNNKFNQYMTNPSELQKDMAKAKEEVKAETNKKEQKRTAKKLNKIADRFNWKGSSAEINAAFEENKKEIEDLGGEAAFVQALDDDKKEKFNKARQDNKVLKSVHERIDDIESLTDAQKRNIKDKLNVPNDQSVEDKIRSIADEVDNVIAPSVDVELTSKERENLQEVVEKARRELYSIADEVKDFYDRIQDEKEPYLNPNISDEQEPVDTGIQDEPEVDQATAKETNHESNRTLGEKISPSNQEVVKPSLSEYALNAVDNTSVSEWYEDEKNIPNLGSKYTNEDFVKYIRELENKLHEVGAFEFVKHHLRKGAEIEYVIDEQLNEAAGQTIVLLRVKSGDTYQIVGSMQADIDFEIQLENSKYKTVKERDTNKYRLYNSIVEQYQKDKKEGTYEEGKVYGKSKVTELKAGTFSLTSIEHTVSETFADKIKDVIIGVVKDGKVVNSKNIDMENISITEKMRPGQVYVLIPTNSGIYLPAIVYSTPLRNINNWDNDVYITSLVNKLVAIKDTNADSKDRYLSELRRVLRTEKGFTYQLVKQEGKKLIVENNPERATKVRFTLNDTNFVRTYDIDKFDDAQARELLREIIREEKKNDFDVTTGVDINQLSNPDYVAMIADYLNFNIGEPHSTNDYFIYDIPTDKEEEVRKDNRVEPETKIEVRDGETVTIENGEAVDNEGVPVEETPEEVTDTLNEEAKKDAQEKVIEEEKSSENDKQDDVAAKVAEIDSLFGESSTTYTPNIRLFTSDNPNEKVEGQKSLDEDLEVLKAMFPELAENDRIIIAESLRGIVDRNGNPITTYAYYMNGVMYFATKGPKGRAFHESFHYIADYILNNFEKKRLFNEAKIRYNTQDEIIAEEKLAEDFRKFMNDIRDNTLKGFIRRTFMKLKRFINVMADNTTSMDNLFWNIYATRYIPTQGKQDNFIQRLEDYRANRLKYENLDEATKEYMREARIDIDNYKKLTTRQKEYLLHCM